MMLFFALCCGNITHAQSPTQTLLNDNDISWLAELESFYYIDNARLNESHSTQGFPIKLIFSDACAYNELPFTKHIINAVLNAKITAYKTSELKEAYSNPTSLREILINDTIITFDSKLQEEEIKVYQNKYPIIHFVYAFKVKQLLYFDKKSKEFKNQIIAIAPVIAHENSDNYTTPFWIKPQQLINKSISNNNLTWIKSLKQSSKLGDWTILKSQESIGEIIMNGAKSNEFNAYKIDNCKQQELSRAELAKKIAPRIDTITLYDEKLYEEEIMVIQHKEEVKADDITHISLVQHWYWDNENQAFDVQLKAIAPIVKYPISRNRSYSLPLFWLLNP